MGRRRSPLVAKVMADRQWDCHSANIGRQQRPDSGLATHVMSQATWSAASVGRNSPPPGDWGYMPPAFCKCLLPVWEILLPMGLCAAPPAHSPLPYRQDICGRWGHIPGVSAPYLATHRGPHKWAALTLGFPACQPTREDTNEEPVAANQPAATQALQVVLARVNEDTRSAAAIPDFGPVALRRKKFSHLKPPAQPLGHLSAHY